MHNTSRYVVNFQTGRQTVQSLHYTNRAKKLYWSIIMETIPIPGNNWKYGVGFLVGLVVTVIIIIVLANKYGKATPTPQASAPAQAPAQTPAQAPSSCTADGSPSTSNGSDCCSSNGVDDNGNCNSVSSSCTPDGAPSTSSGTDCCSSNGVDSLGNCAPMAGEPVVSLPPSSSSAPATGTSSFSTEPADF